MEHPPRIANWLDMADIDRALVAPVEWQRSLKNQPLGVGPPVPGEGSWRVLRASDALVSLVDFKIEDDFVDHIILDECVMFQFALDGSMCLDIPNRSPVRHNGFRCTMMTFREGRLVRRLEGRSGRIRYIGVVVPFETLIRDYGVTTEMLAGDFRRFMISSSRKVRVIDYPLQRDQLLASHAILECRLSGALRDRFMEAKLSELICLTLAHVAKPGVQLSHSEREQLSIEAAAEMLSTLGQRLSIADLSRRVGLNRSKFITGFRDRYGTTPAEFARAKQLDHARKLITETCSSMFEIAELTGFTSQSSFSRAYRARFDTSPREDRRASAMKSETSRAKA